MMVPSSGKNWSNYKNPYGFGILFIIFLIKKNLCKHIWKIVHISQPWFTYRSIDFILVPKNDIIILNIYQI